MDKKILYVSPEVEVIEVEVEKGFATSNGNDGSGSTGGFNPY